MWVCDCRYVIEMNGFCYWPDTKKTVRLQQGKTNSLTYRQQGQLLFHTQTTKLCDKVRYRGTDKSLARHNSRCILCDRIFRLMLILFYIIHTYIYIYIYIYVSSINIPPIMIINRIYETQNLLSL